MHKKIGALQLSGLIAGAVLGSGVILLPPIAQAQLGQWAVAGWLVIMGLGAAFAMVFAMLALAYPGAEGAPIAIRKAFGARAGRLASIYLLCAVCAGPVAVLMTAASTISRALHLQPNVDTVIAGGLLLLCACLLTRRIALVGSIAFAASIAVSLTLVAGSVTTILNTPVLPIPGAPFDVSAMGRTLLVLFWAIIGWEIIGNYTMDVRTPRRTIPWGTALAATMICGVYILVAWALAVISPGNGTSRVSDVVTILLGPFADIVVMLITTALCACTYLMIVGGISRLAASLAVEKHLPPVLAKRNEHDAPVAAMLCIVGFECASLVLLHLQVISLEEIVCIANVFFLSNSLLAISAAMRLIASWPLRMACALLFMGFISFLAFSPPWILAGLGVITCAVQAHEAGFPQKIRKAAST